MLGASMTSEQYSKINNTTFLFVLKYHYYWCIPYVLDIYYLE